MTYIIVFLTVIVSIAALRNRTGSSTTASGGG